VVAVDAEASVDAEVVVSSPQAATVLQIRTRVRGERSIRRL